MGGDCMNKKLRIGLIVCLSVVFLGSLGAMFYRNIQLKKNEEANKEAETLMQQAIEEPEKPQQEEAVSTQQKQQQQSGLQPVEPETDTQPSQRDDSPYFYYEFPFSFGN